MPTAVDGQSLNHWTARDVPEGGSSRMGEEAGTGIPAWAQK